MSTESFKDRRRRLLAKMRERRMNEALGDGRLTETNKEKAEARTEMGRKPNTEKSITPAEESGRAVANNIIQVENYLEVNGDQVKVEDVVARIVEAYDGYITKLQTY